MSRVHNPVMPREVLDALFTRADGFYIDGTFGRGGHSRLLLEKLGSAGTLLAMDRDQQAVDAAGVLQSDHPNMRVEHADFASMARLVERLGWQQNVTGILLDLGVSSPQLDAGERGFSFMRDGPLDMRMDRSTGVSAAAWLAEADVETIARVLRDYGEENYAMRIARAIVERRQREAIGSTHQLVDVVEQAVPKRDQGKHKATRTFQAIRIHINDELGQLERILNDSLDMLECGGRLVIISFHSLEDRMVKRFMRDKSRGDALPAKLPVRDSELNKKLKIVVRSGRATKEEVAVNPRARSAILRAAEKL